MLPDILNYSTRFVIDRLKLQKKLLENASGKKCLMGGRVREAIDPFIVGYAAGVFSTCLRKNDVGVGDIDPQTGEAAVERLLDELEDMFPLIRLHNAGTSRERAGFFFGKEAGDREMDLNALRVIYDLANPFFGSWALSRRTRP